MPLEYVNLRVGTDTDALSCMRPRYSHVLPFGFRNIVVVAGNPVQPVWVTATIMLSEMLEALPWVIYTSYVAPATGSDGLMEKDGVPEMAYREPVPVSPAAELLTVESEKLELSEYGGFEFKPPPASRASTMVSSTTPVGLVMKVKSVEFVCSPSALAERTR